MSIQPSTVVQVFTEHNIPFEQRPRLLALALARFIAYKLPIPVEAVPDPYIYFTTALKMGVDRDAAVFNERLVISMEAVAETTRRLWLVRYMLVHDVHNPSVRNFMDAMIRVGAPNIPASVSELLIEPASDAVLQTLQYALAESYVEEPRNE